VRVAVRRPGYRLEPFSASFTCCQGMRYKRVAGASVSTHALHGKCRLCTLEGGGIGSVMRSGGAVPWIAKRRVVWSVGVSALASGSVFGEMWSGGQTGS